MTTYRKLHGKAVKTVTTNPTDDAAEGQIWFNSTDNKFKSAVAISAWASAASMITARGYGSANGTQTASLYTGGLEPGGTYYANTEEYNGSGWSAGGALPATNYASGSAGTQTAALLFGGGNGSGQVGTTYTYNGSSWTSSPNSLNLTRDYICGTGTQTSALAYCGRVTSPSLAVVTNFEEWNGSSWTALTAAPTAVALSMGEGPETASFFASGGTNNGGPPYVSTAQEYNGSTLSTGGSVNTGRAAGGAAGNSSAGLIFGGDAGGTSQTKTETYDGTSFSEIADMSTAMRGMGNGSGATNAAAVAAASYGPPALGTTEEFTTSGSVITAAAWSSGGNLGTARTEIGGAGSQTASLCAGGQASGSFVTSVEEYNGTSWSEVNDIPTATRGFGGAGTQTASVMFGGENPPSTTITTAYNYDGTNWTSTGALNTDRTLAGNGGTGTQTAALAVAGYEKPGSPPGNGAINAVEEFNGSSWSSNPNNYPASIYSVHHAGTQTAALLWGGATSPGTAQTTSFTYDGSSFSAGATLLTGTVHSAPSGDQTAAMSANDHPQSSFCQFYNGTVWSTNPSTSTARHAGSSGKSGAPAPAAWIAGGYTSTFSNATEEFTAETTSGNVKDFTTS